MSGSANLHLFERWNRKEARITDGGDPRDYNRPSKIQWAMRLTRVVATRATCPRRQVGAIIFDEDGQILSTGYNGPSRGVPHCLTDPCGGQGAASGESLDKCIAVHAEQNAILQCGPIQRAMVLAVSTSPCDSCMKLLMNTPIQMILFDEIYDKKVLQQWLNQGRAAYLIPH